MKSSVSVIIPIYNSDNYLEKCISSVLAQLYKDIEVILVDDGSTDNSGMICDDFSKKDSRIQVVHVQNSGVSNARNLGIQKASGKYLFFVDSDDFIDCNMIADQVRAMESADADLCVSALSEMDLGTSFCIDLNGKCDNEMFFLLKNHLLFGPMAKLYRKDIVDNNGITFPTDFSYGEDLLFNSEFLRYAGRICYINQCYYHYVTENTQSLSRKVRWDAFENDMILHCRLQNWAKEKGLLSDKIKVLLADRVVGTANDAIALLYRADCQWSRVKQFRYIRSILHDELVSNSLKYADTSAYASWIIRGMKQKNSLLFWMIAQVKRGIKQ